MAINFNHLRNEITTDDGNISFPTTGAVKIPVGTSGQRPGNGLNGYIRYNTTTDSLEGYFNSGWTDIGGGSLTDLGYITAPSEGTVTSSDGNNVVIPVATTTFAGLFDSIDKLKLDGIEAGASADLSGSEIKILYEGEPDTNVFSDSEQFKLGFVSGELDRYITLYAPSLTTPSAADGWYLVGDCTSPITGDTDDTVDFLTSYSTSFDGFANQCLAGQGGTWGKPVWGSTPIPDNTVQLVRYRNYLDFLSRQRGQIIETWKRDTTGPTSWTTNSPGLTYSGPDLDLIFNIDGSITLTGTVDGRDIAADGTKLDTIATGANVIKVGTPVDNQVGVWTGNGTIEGTTGLTYDGVSLNVTGNITGSLASFSEIRTSNYSSVVSKAINVTDTVAFTNILTLGDSGTWKITIGGSDDSLGQFGLHISETYAVASQDSSVEIAPNIIYNLAGGGLDVQWSGSTLQVRAQNSAANSYVIKLETLSLYVGSVAEVTWHI